jgi:hypothetical protein
VFLFSGVSCQSDSEKLHDDKSSISYTKIILDACVSNSFFRPPTEAERLQEQQTIREQEYLKGALLDGLVQAAGTSDVRAMNH